VALALASVFAPVAPVVFVAVPVVVVLDVRASV
jgi:hypothetical protein